MRLSTTLLPSPHVGWMCWFMQEEPRMEQQRAKVCSLIVDFILCFLFVWLNVTQPCWDGSQRSTAFGGVPPKLEVFLQSHPYAEENNCFYCYNIKWYLSQDGYLHDCISQTSSKELHQGCGCDKVQVWGSPGGKWNLYLMYSCCISKDHCKQHKQIENINSK